MYCIDYWVIVMYNVLFTSDCSNNVSEVHKFIHCFINVVKLGEVTELLGTHSLHSSERAQHFFTVMNEKSNYFLLDYSSYKSHNVSNVFKELYIYDQYIIKCPTNEMMQNHNIISGIISIATNNMC